MLHSKMSKLVVFVAGMLLGVATSSATASNYTFTTIDVPGAAYGTEPYAINNAGEIVGYYGDATGAAQGFSEPPRVCRRLFRLSHAAMAGCSVMA